MRARKRPLEETLAALRRVRESPEDEASRAELRRVLSGEGSHAVARAAALVGELLLRAVREEAPAVARDALLALSSLGAAEALVERARRAAATRPELAAALERAFGGSARPPHPPA